MCDIYLRTLAGMVIYFTPLKWKFPTLPDTPRHYQPAAPGSHSHGRSWESTTRGERLWGLSFGLHNGIDYERVVTVGETFHHGQACRPLL